MALPIYICRTESPSTASENPISLDEWKRLVLDIPQMHLYEGEEALPDYIDPPEPSEGLARWAGHPRADVIWFYYRDGAICVEGYDAYVLGRMRGIASRIGARVMGADGRFM